MDEPNTLNSGAALLRGIRGAMRILVDPGVPVVNVAERLCVDGALKRVKIRCTLSNGSIWQAGAGEEIAATARVEDPTGQCSLEVSSPPLTAEQLDWLRELACDLLQVLEEREKVAELRVRDSHIRLLANDMRDVVSVYDLEAERTLFVSASVERMRGFTPAEVMAATMSDAFEPESEAHLRRVLPERIRAFEAGDESEHSDRLAFKKKDGTFIWAVCTTRMHRSPIDGHLVACSVVRDLADQEKIESQQELLREMGRISKLGGWEVDTLNGKGQWTPEVAHIHALDPSAVPSVGLGLRYYNEESRPIIAAAFKAASEQGIPYDLQLEMVDAAGQHKWIRTAGVSVYVNGRIAKVRGILQDISEQKQMEHEAQTRARQQGAVAELGRKALAGCSLPELHREAIRHISEICRVDQCWILGYDDGPPPSWSLLAGTKTWKEPHPLEDAPGASYALRNRVPVLTPNVAEETRFDTAPMLAKGVWSALSVPIACDHDIFGVLTAASTGARELTVHDVSFLESVANVLGETTQRLQTEAALRLSEERSTLAMRGSAAGIWDWDLARDEVFYSSRFKALLGYTDEDFPGHQGVLSSIHPDELEFRNRAVAEHLQSPHARPFDIFLRLRTKDGNYRWFNSRGVAGWTDGVATRMTGSMVDVHERKLAETMLQDALEQARASGERFKLLANVTRDAIWDLDLKQQRTWRSDGFAALFGYANEDLEANVGAWTNRIAPEDRARVQAGFSAFLAGSENSWTEEYHFMRHDGSLAYVLDRGYMIRDESGAPSRVIGGVTDLSERRARQEAEQASQLKGQFLANMSHELRTPLNAILGTAHLALATSLSDRQRKYVEQIQRGGQALLRVVNDILDMSKVEAGRIELEQIELNLETAIEEVLAVVALEAHQKGLELAVRIAPEVPTRLVGDPVRLGQILINLIGNAVKFTKAGEIVLEITLEELQESTVDLSFSVRDTGIGMSSDQLAGLFTAFSQADNSITRRYGGSGLGLALCRRLVALMGGEIHVESEMHEGSRFFFEARFGRTAAAPAPCSEYLLRARGKRAAVIDDNETARSILADGLQQLGMKTVELDDADVVFLALRPGASVPNEILAAIERRSEEATRQPDRRREPRRTALVLMSPSGTTGPETPATGANVHVLFKPCTRLTLTPLVEMLMGGPDRRSSSRRDTHTHLPVFGGVRVLLVEDNPVNQQIAQELLQSAGIVVDLADNGRQALDRVLSSTGDRPWDLILMDVQMSEMDGYSATAAIRREPRFATLPIVALTAHVLQDERARCYEAGMNDYISKPIDPPEMFATLQRWLTGRLEPKPQSTASFPVIPGLNSEAGLARVAGNAGLYRSLLLRLVHGRESTLGALGSDDLAQVQFLAHNLKGEAGSLGLVDVQAHASELEHLARSGQGDALAPVFDSLRKSLEGVSQEILATLEPASTEASSRGKDLKPLDELLERLTLQLESYDGSSSETLCEAMPLLRSCAGAASAEKLEMLVANFDFPAALGEVKRIRGSYSRP